MLAQFTEPHYPSIYKKHPAVGFFLAGYKLRDQFSILGVYRISAGVSLLGDSEYQLGYRVGVDIEYQILGDIGYQLEVRYRISARF